MVGNNSTKNVMNFELGRYSSNGSRQDGGRAVQTTGGQSVFPANRQDEPVAAFSFSANSWFNPDRPRRAQDDSPANPTRDESGNDGRTRQRGRKPGRFAFGKKRRQNQNLSGGAGGTGRLQDSGSPEGQPQEGVGNAKASGGGVFGCANCRNHAGGHTSTRRQDGAAPDTSRGDGGQNVVGDGDSPSGNGDGNNISDPLVRYMVNLLKPFLKGNNNGGRVVDDGRQKSIRQYHPASCWANAALAAAHNMVGNLTQKLKNLAKYVPRALRGRFYTGGTEMDEKRVIEANGGKGEIRRRVSRSEIARILKNPNCTGIVVNIPGHATAIKPGENGGAVFRDSGNGTTKKISASNLMNFLKRLPVVSIVIAWKKKNNNNNA